MCLYYVHRLQKLDELDYTTDIQLYLVEICKFVVLDLVHL